ncbi:acylpyruvase FAHD1, mitochondrial-like [Haliotis rufescens]|uniref:acylpyruvase FAHD1, mitochondrial-like n=1 Tax=Haliotis rufescens TaxID=6454 RepID=UPI001EB04D13|nr:acylpyruvase FAHD1, mitochondrial-like [Haliotis rufescens]
MSNTTKVARFLEFGKKIICVGRNYSEHAAELGNPVPKKPILFLKPTTAYVTAGDTVKIPKGCSSLHHEVELGVVIGEKACDVAEPDAMKHVGGYVLALDMTARDFQDEAKKKGQPWTMAKGFDTSCPVGEFIEKSKIPDPSNVQLWLKVNSDKRQDGNTKDMIFNVPYLISYVSQYFTLEPGDLLLTGTPSGVGPVVEGDVMEAGIGDISTIKFSVERR